MQEFISSFSRKGEVVFPEFSGTRIMMMPVVLGDVNSLPESLRAYQGAVEDLFSMQEYDGQIGYLTIDEKLVDAGVTHRRPGMHVDGVYRKMAGGWGGGGGGWGGGGYQLPEPRPRPEPRPKPQPGERPNPGRGLSSGFGTGFLTVSSLVGCKAWDQEFSGFPGDEGECEHLASQCRKDAEEVLRANAVYWLDPLCVHESLPIEQTGKRQFLRLSLPSTAPWFEGYTENPLGVKPTGEILSRRDFMDYQ